MRKFILPAGVFAFAFFAVAVLLVVQLFVVFLVEENTKIYEGNCAGTTLEKKGDSVKLNLNCGGKKAYTVGLETIVEHSKNPSSVFSCSLYKSGKAFCEVSEKNKKSTK